MITVKEEFLSHPKTQRAIKLGGWSVLGLWLGLKGYVASANSGGFVPREAIDSLPGIPKRWEKALRALLDCGHVKPDGSRGPGLLEQVEHGYMLHDYEDHGTPVEVEDQRRAKARARKAAYRERLAERGTDAGHVPGTERGTAPARARAREHERPPAPGPARIPAQPSPARDPD